MSNAARAKVRVTWQQPLPAWVLSVYPPSEEPMSWWQQILEYLRVLYR